MAAASSHARLALIVRQSVQTTGIQVDPQTVTFASPSPEATILLERSHLAVAQHELKIWWLDLA
jgi:hypothetical protein